MLLSHRMISRSITFPELPDISAPFHLGQCGERIFLDDFGFLAVFGAYFLDEVMGQRRNVLAAFAQRRNRNDDHAQPVVEVFPEIAHFDFVQQVFVGGRDDPHVDGDVLVASDPADPVFLQGPQYFWPAPKGSCRRFRRGKRSSVGLFEFCLCAVCWPT